MRSSSESYFVYINTIWIIVKLPIFLLFVNELVFCVVLYTFRFVIDQLLISSIIRVRKFWFFIYYSSSVIVLVFQGVFVQLLLFRWYFILCSQFLFDSLVDYWFTIIFSDYIINDWIITINAYINYIAVLCLCFWR